MKVTWYGHSCFRLEGSRGSVVLDPYEPGSVPGLGPVETEAELVLCSHGHADHSYAKGVRLSGKESGFRYTVLESYHDEARGLRRGKNNIHILECDGLKAVHLGDLGCKPGPKQLSQLMGADLLMIPVGGHFTIDAETAKNLADALEPRVLIPMHYRGEGFGYDVIAPVADYLALCGNAVFYPGSELEIDQATPKQTAILRPMLAI